ncbi:MAG TPA: hypothetical protein VM692_09735 [Gammaproteobacteria bacterium]|nr:hypothetical protein [Gammaproteobacteria bacterium]
MLTEALHAMMFGDDLWLFAGAVLGAVIAAAIPWAAMTIVRLVGALPRILRLRQVGKPDRP